MRADITAGTSLSSVVQGVAFSCVPYVVSRAIICRFVRRVSSDLPWRAR
jgi:hypothetical protein